MQAMKSRFIEGVKTDDKHEKCSKCGNEMFEVYFGNDDFYSDKIYKRCFHCNELHIYPKIDNEE